MQTTAGVEETGESDREDRGWAGGEKEGVGGVPFEEMSVIKRKKKQFFCLLPIHLHILVQRVSIIVTMTMGRDSCM